MRGRWVAGLALVLALAVGCSGERSKEPQPVPKSMKARLPPVKAPPRS
jgi:hypothetical protein